MPRRAADLLVDCLAAHSVDRVFCVPGESYLAVLDALHDSNAIQTIICRHEGGAGFMAVGRCTLPTVAAVNGAAVGAGLNLALAADVRIAGPHALFDPRFQKLGIHPGGGATWMLQRAVGPQVARAALLFGMRFDAESAVRHGLALAVADDPVAAALELAAGPAAAPREVVLSTKASMRATAIPGFLDTEHHEAAKDIELGPQATSIESPEFKARLAAAQRR